MIRIFEQAIAKGGNHLTEQNMWPIELQQALQQTIHAVFQSMWTLYDEGSEKGFIADFHDTADMLKSIEILRIDRSEKITKFYATVSDPKVKSVGEIQTLVHHIVSLVDEDFCIFMPLHDEEALRFWYMTGTASHGHEGMVIIKKADIPQVIY